MLSGSLPRTKRSLTPWVLQLTLEPEMQGKIEWNRDYRPRALGEKYHELTTEDYEIYESERGIYPSLYLPCSFFSSCSRLSVLLILLIHLVRELREHSLTFDWFASFITMG